MMRNFDLVDIVGIIEVIVGILSLAALGLACLFLAVEWFDSDWQVAVEVHAWFSSSHPWLEDALRAAGLGFGFLFVWFFLHAFNDRAQRNSDNLEQMTRQLDVMNDRLETISGLLAEQLNERWDR